MVKISLSLLIKVVRECCFRLVKTSLVNISLLFPAFSLEDPGIQRKSGKDLGQADIPSTSVMSARVKNGKKEGGLPPLGTMWYILVPSGRENRTYGGQMYPSNKNSLKEREGRPKCYYRESYYRKIWWKISTKYLGLHF